MTRTENLLATLSEECSEVQKDVSKTLRFGPYGKRTELSKTNRDHLVMEFYHIQAVLQMLQIEGVLPELRQDEIDDIVSDKISRVEENILKSIKLGRVK